MTDAQKIEADKEVQFYAAKANAWFNTKLEHDKSILILSSGAIGLLITLLTTVGVQSITLLILFIASLISFVVCLVSILAIFLRNAKYLEKLIQGKKTNDTVLGYLDAVTIFSFILGVILATIIGVSVAANNVLSKENTMSKKDNTTNKTVEFKESFNGANNLSPSNSDALSKSFNGAQNIAPQSNNDSSSSTTSTTTTQTTGQSQASSSSSSSGDKK